MKILLPSKSPAHQQTHQILPSPKEKEIWRELLVKKESKPKVNKHNKKQASLVQKGLVS